MYTRIGILASNDEENVKKTKDRVMEREVRRRGVKGKKMNGRGGNRGEERSQD